MIEIDRLTMEQALRLSFTDNPQNIDHLIKAKKGTSYTVTLTHTFEVPAEYARVIFLEWLQEKVETEGAKHDTT
jgi:hypothetical protein